MNNITLSIIIVNYNTGTLLQKCLYSIKDTLKNISYEIFIVDNHSSDDSYKILHNFKDLNIHLIKNGKNMGFPYANNQALKFVRGTYILLLNPDTILTQGAVENMIDYLQNNLQVGVLGPKVLYPNGKLQYSAFLFPNIFDVLFDILFLNKLFPKSKVFGRKRMSFWDHSEIKEVDAVSGCCLLLRKKVYREIGGLDENLFFMDDVDFCKRVKNKGWKIVYFPLSIIYHCEGGSSKNNRYFPAYFGRISRILYFKKYYHTLTNILVIFLTLVEISLRMPLEFMGYLIKRSTRSKTRLEAYFKVIVFILNRNTRSHESINNK